jgi:hypothetical protein
MMKFAAVAAVALAGLAAASLAAAQDAAPPPADAAIKAFPDYAHTDIGADACKTLDAATAECVIPPGTAGSYLVEADGTSTADDAHAVQAMVIRGDSWVCSEAQTKLDPAKPWASGPRTLKVGCKLTVLADAPLIVRAVYADSHAVKDPKGPVMTVKRIPWNGVLDARPAGAAAE